MPGASVYPHTGGWVHRDVPEAGYMGLGLSAWGCVYFHNNVVITCLSSLVLGEGAACCGYTTLTSEI